MFLHTSYTLQGGERGQGGPPFPLRRDAIAESGGVVSFTCNLSPPQYLPIFLYCLPVAAAKFHACIYTTCIFTLLLLCSTDTAASACFKRHATGYDFNALHPAAESVDEDLSDFCVFVVSFVSPISLSVGMNGCATGHDKRHHICSLFPSLW